MEYPEHHLQITNSLIDGKFILSNEEYFKPIKENLDFYTQFFKKSFNYELIYNEEFAYIISSETSETISRDISIFFSILCYEMDRDGKNFMEQLESGEFTLEDIDDYFENTSFIDLVESNKQMNDSDKRRNLINLMARRNIIEKHGDNRFTFNPSYKVFIEFAKELAISRLTKAN